jgi:GNAT superfamily N-acetyltransferase
VERTEAAEIEGLRDVFAAVPADVASELGMSSLDLGEAVAGKVEFLSGSTEANHAIGVTSADQLDAIAEFYGATRHAVSPSRGVDLDAELRGRGYEPGYAWTKFAREPQEVPEPRTDLRVVEVGQDDDLDFGETVREGSGMPLLFVHWLARLPGRPGWHCFVAYDGREPAGAGALYVHGDLGWLGLGATLPELRRRGAQSAILAARIRRAAELGCSLIVTETGELVDERPSISYRNILRVGFEEQYVRPNYLSRSRAAA